MKLNKYLFWIFSLAISLTSCWLFERSANELYSDVDYMTSLNLPPNADTPMIPIAGGFIASFFIAIAHGIVHAILLIFLIFNKKRKRIHLNFKVGTRINRFSNIVLIVSYIICGWWLLDYLSVATIKFYFYNTVFLVFAIATTMIYGWWVQFIFYRNPEESGYKLGLVK